MRQTEASRARWLTVGLVAIAGLSLLVRLHVPIVVDREGGVVAIGLRRAPGWQDTEETSTEAFRADGNWILLAGDEGGVHGMEALRWHSRGGAWVIWSCSLLGVAGVWWRRQGSRRSAG